MRSGSRKTPSWFQYGKPTKGSVIETIDLETTYESCFDESFTIDEICESRNCPYPSNLLKDSMYVQFLIHFKDKMFVTDDEIKESRYFKTAWRHVETYGPFNGKSDQSALVQYCREFLNLYRALKTKYNVSWLSSLTAALDNRKYGHAVGFKILNSDHYMVYDGHHRLACQYVLGKRLVKLKIVGVKNNNCQAREF